MEFLLGTFIAALAGSLFIEEVELFVSFLQEVANSTANNNSETVYCNCFLINKNLKIKKRFDFDYRGKIE